MNGKSVYGLFVLCLVMLPAFGPLSRADDAWPTLHRDYQRSGYTPQVVKGPYERKWFRDFHGEMIASRVEAIVAEGKCFIPTFAGNIYAMDIVDGKTVWSFKVPGPVGYSPCYSKGNLYFGSDEGFDRGYLYCLRAADGLLQWKHLTNAGVWTSPACDGKKVYFGDRAGVFHAVDADTGRAVWTFKTGYMILTPASFSEDMREVVFASEDMNVYCLDTDGKLLWKSAKLPGLSLRDHAVTIWKGLAIVRSNPADGFHTVMGLDGQMLKQTQQSLEKTAEDEVIFDQWGDLLMKETPRRREAEKQAVIEYLEKKPAYQTFHALNLQDGKKVWTSQVLFTTGLHNPPTPPVFNSDSGRLFTFYRTAMTAYHRGIRRYSAIGEVNRHNGRIDFSWPETRHGINDFYGFPMIGDETQALSIMGNVLISNHQGEICGIDLDTMKMVSIWRGRDTYGGIFGPGAVAGTFEGAKKLALEGYLTGMPNEWHGPDRSIVAIAEGRMFWVVGSQVVCIAGPDIPATESGGTKSPAPIKNKLDLVIGGNMTESSNALDESVRKEDIKTDAVRILIDKTIPAEVRQSQKPLAGKLRKLLDAEVLELIEDGPWAPFILELGIVREEEYFRKTSETMQILSLALPHLSQDVRQRTAGYLRKMLADGMPLDTAEYSHENRKPRTYHDYGPGMEAFSRRNPRYDATIEDIYALWACAYYGQLWNEVFSQIERIERIYDRFMEKPFQFDHLDSRRDSAEHLNRQIAGLIAYIRIMESAGRTENTRQAQIRLSQMLSERVYHEKTSSMLICHTDQYGMGNSGHNAKISRYVGLVPELAAFLQEHAGEKLEYHVNGIDTQLPLWYQAFGERMIGGENYISPAHLAGSVFIAMADGLEASPEKLAKKLDQPWCHADLYYIEKLSAILRRMDSQK